MSKVFNTTGPCNPQKHYMVDISSKLAEIKVLVDDGAYFIINRARQYGKTTTLSALTRYLSDDYAVINLDFQMIGSDNFNTEHTFTKAFVNLLSQCIGNCNNKDIDIEQLNELIILCEDESFELSDMFPLLSEMCDNSKDKIVLVIDEVDNVINNQVFSDFLTQLRAFYLERNNIGTPTFHSVIFFSVYDIKNIKREIRSDEECRHIIPWNIATDFKVDMSFSKDEILGMLSEYEEDYNTGMDKDAIAQMIFDSTSGYPFLVSRLCQLIDRDIAGTDAFPDKASAWTREGYIEAEKMLIRENNNLFSSFVETLIEYPYLKKLISAILFEGLTLSYVFDNSNIEIAAMIGLVKNVDNHVAVSNRIFETVLYNHFLSEELNDAAYAIALSEKSRFIKDGKLDMQLILERFVVVFTEICNYKDESFREELGRKYFMLFLKPIIDETGYSYIDPRTRDVERTDIVVDYHGEQFIIELKIRRRQQDNDNCEKQIAEYLDFYKLKKGYMIIFDFNNNNKIVSVTDKKYGDCIIIEATV